MAEAPRENISEEEVSALLEKDAPDGVRPYDFAAQRINRTQLPLLEVVSKAFADRASASLAALLSRDASVHFTSLELGKSPDLQAALPVPASLATVRLKPLPGNAFVSVEPGLLLALLDGFFGGTGRPNNDPQAAIAPAAQRFLALMLKSFAADLNAAWTPVTPVDLELVKQETNPRLAQLGAPHESLLVLKFTVEFAAVSGRMDWFLTEGLLAPIRETLAADGGQSAPRRQEPWAPTIGSALQDARIDVRAVLAEARLSLRELVRLQTGDIIPIEPPREVALMVGDVPVHRGRFGVSQGRNALKIIPGADS
ncbi:MAG TPA: FliM/FliN family flagellar motor switch protein [Steroidobacteraceae bacterium]|jgi:flagellar motor switch protein FliM|nr:FliM/FliN family flagellar motor switch protein [Steroidobacteraceae bacterium]